MGVESDSSDGGSQCAVPVDSTSVETSTSTSTSGASIKRFPLATPAAGLTVPHAAGTATDDDGADNAAVKWLLGADLLRKVLLIGRSLVANELDLRDWMTPGLPLDLSAGDELWFDYIAD